jgi:intracellular sulfur oxidation DsrE/DsrF family protein
MMCHNAMTFVASLLSHNNNASVGAILADFQRNVLPGFTVVPAGVAMVQLAQQHGYTLFALG